MSNNRYKEKENPPCNLPTPYLPKELDIVSSGDNPKTIPENIGTKEEIEAKKTKIIEWQAEWNEKHYHLRMAEAEEETGGFPGTSGSLVSRSKNKKQDDPNVLLKLPISGFTITTVRVERQDINTKGPLPVPNALREAFIEGAEEDDASEEIRRLVKLAKSMEPPVRCGNVGIKHQLDIVDVEPNKEIGFTVGEYVSVPADDGLQGIIFENTKEAKKKAVILLRDMLAEIREKLRIEATTKRKKRK